MSSSSWQRPRRGGFLLLVLLAHGLLAVLLTLSLQRSARFAVAPATAPGGQLVWLRPPPSPPVAPPSPAPAAPKGATPHAPAQSRKQSAQEQPKLRPTQSTAPANEPQPITLPPVPADVSTSPVARANPASAPLQLDLRLPSQRASQPQPAAALTRDDPRVKERLDYGERMARTIGTDNKLHEEVQPDGTWRFSKGTGCVMARKARISELDSFNQSSMPVPRSIGPC